MTTTMENPEVMVSARELAMMRHCTGGCHDGRRNYYCVELDHADRHRWERLVGLGLAAPGEPDGKVSPVVFHLTDAGYVFAYGRPHVNAPICAECGEDIASMCTECVGEPGTCSVCSGPVCGDCLFMHEDACRDRVEMPDGQCAPPSAADQVNVKIT